MKIKYLSRPRRRMGEWSIDPPVLTVGSKMEVSGQLQASAALLPGVELPVPDQGAALCAP